MCGHTPGKVAGRQETVKAEMNGLMPGLDRSPPPRWMGGQGGQSLKVFGRTRSFWGLSSPKIEMGGKALKWLSRLDYPLAKTGSPGFANARKRWKNKMENKVKNG